MYKKTIKLFGLLILLILSFIYTDKVVSEAENNNLVMKKVKIFKTKNDISPIEPSIINNELALGFSGLEVDTKASFKNMKKENKFDKDKIIYKSVLPKNNISKNYDYYINKGNSKEKKVSLIFKVKKEDDINEITKLLKTSKQNVTFFVDGIWLEENVNDAFKLSNLSYQIYNLGYNGIYEKNLIEVTNNLLETITLKDSSFCLNDKKNDKQKEICKKKKMHTIKSTLLNPSITELKENLDRGIIITYDLYSFNYKEYNVIINTICSRGYEIVSLSNLMKE